MASEIVAQTGVQRAGSRGELMGLILSVVTVVISLLALVISLYALIKMRPLQKLQERIAQFELEQRLEAKAAGRRADIRAEISCASDRLWITNHGQGTAENVNIRFLDKEDPVNQSEREEKLPAPILRAGDSVTLIAACAGGRAPPFKVVLTWNDPDGTPRSYEQVLYGS